MHELVTLLLALIILHVIVGIVWIIARFSG